MGEEKTCRSCGRRITWRKKWERDWDSVTYCSSACRSRGVTAEDRQLEVLIRQLLAGAPRGIRDDEVLAALPTPAAEDSRPGHRPRRAGRVTPQEAVRRAARRLVTGGELEMLQGGRVVDPSTATGPVLLRRRRR